MFSEHTMMIVGWALAGSMLSLAWGYRRQVKRKQQVIDDILAYLKDKTIVKKAIK